MTIADAADLIARDRAARESAAPCVWAVQIDHDNGFLNWRWESCIRHGGERLWDVRAQKPYVFRMRRWKRCRV